VEAALLRLSVIREAIVTSQRKSSGDEQMIAYVVPRADRFLPGEIRGALKQWLPGHMIPSKFVVLESLPLTSGGKIDRLRLPLPDEAAATRSRGDSAPLNSTEALLVKMWKEALKVTRLDIHDNFFDLGGDSIIAMKILSAIDRSFARSVSITEFFDAASVAAVAALLKEKAGMEAPSAAQSARSDVDNDAQSAGAGIAPTQPAPGAASQSCSAKTFRPPATEHSESVDEN
jgi:acyl carrier protein